MRRSVDRHRWGSTKVNAGGADPTSGTQGVLLIQIDGLGFDELGQACESGLMPNLARLRAGEPYRVAPLYAGVPSSTPAFQAELFYGCEGAQCRPTALSTGRPDGSFVCRIGTLRARSRPA